LRPEARGPAFHSALRGARHGELVRGEIRDESRTAYQGVIERLVDRGAQGVILGCTEIELLIGPEDCSVPVCPSTRLHAQAAVDFALR
jgi:aspartate racemase